MSESDGYKTVRAAVSAYVLESDCRCTNVSGIIDALDEEYNVKATNKQVGGVLRRLKEDFGATPDDFKWGGPESQYHISNIRKEYRSGLEDEVDDICWINKSSDINKALR